MEPKRRVKRVTSLTVNKSLFGIQAMECDSFSSGESGFFCVCELDFFLVFQQ
jgi:hypothetical protein